MKQFLIALFLLSSTHYLSGQEAQFLIQMESPVSEEVLSKNVAKELGVSPLEVSVESIFKSLNIFSITLEKIPTNKLKVQSNIRGMKGAINVDLNAPVSKRDTPNDQFFVEQWNMEIIQATDAWDITTGGKTVDGKEIVIAVIDSGMNLDHPDLINQLWKNPGEIPNNNIDDDNNGYIDDVTGINVSDNTNIHPMGTHGTSVLGIAGATGNNDIGVSGVNWDVKIMPISEPNDAILTVKAYDYVLNQRKRYDETQGREGAFIVVTNFSLGIDYAFASDFPIWCNIYNELGEAGILNVCATSNLNVNVDLEGDMPSTCSSPYLITVNNTTVDDEKHSSTGFGASHIDIGAPGQGTFTTFNNSSGYGTFGGASASSPHVASAIALLYSAPCRELGDLMNTDPEAAANVVKDAILSSTDELASLVGVTVTGGRLNVYQALLALNTVCSGTQGELDILKINPNPTSGFISIQFETPDYREYTFTITDALGRIVSKDMLFPPAYEEKIITLNVSHYQSGLYFVSFFNENNIITKSFVVN